MVISSVLERAALRSRETALVIASDGLQASEPPRKRQRRARLQHATSEIAAELFQQSTSSDALTVNPANIFTSDAAFPTDSSTQYFSSDPPAPEEDLVDAATQAHNLAHARLVMGELADTPVAQRILRKAGVLTREHLEKMKFIMQLDVEARTDMLAFADDLLGREPDGEIVYEGEAVVVNEGEGDDDRDL